MSTPRPGWHSPLLCLLVLALRLPLAVDQPRSDEGIYAAIGYFDHLVLSGALPSAGWLLPRDGALGLYPLLTCWVHALPWQAMTVLRVVDAVAACAALLVILRFLRAVLPSPPAALAGAVVLAVITCHPLFIDAGFKHPILIAFAFLAAAAQTLHGGRPGAAWQAGVLVGLAVLFREPILPMASVIVLYGLARLHWRQWPMLLGAGALTVLVAVAANVGVRGPGGWAGFVGAYASFDAAIAPLDERWRTTVAQGEAALRVFGWCLPLAALGAAAPWVRRAAALPRTPELWALALLLILATLPEILYKAAFAYHFAQAGLGLALLAGLGWASLARDPEQGPGPRDGARRLALGLALATSLVLARPYAQTWLWSAAGAQRFVPVMLWQDWDHAAAGDSLYLRAAAEVRRTAPGDGRLMTDFHASVLFPLTGRMPAQPGMGSATRVAHGRDPQRRESEQASLLAAPPEVLVLLLQSPDPSTVHPFLRQLRTRYAECRTEQAGLSPYAAWTTQVCSRTGPAPPAPGAGLTRSRPAPA